MKTGRTINNILVTGGAGFIGSAFIRLVLGDEDFSGKIINLDILTYAGNLDNVACVSDDPRYVFVRGNICDKEIVEAIFHRYQIDTIVHFAAESHVDRSIESPISFVESNVMGTVNLLEVARKNPDVHFHHVSTDEVFGSLGEKGKFTEESPYHPNSPYSASKAASDHFVRAYSHTYGLSITLSNCSNNYGAFQHQEKLIPLMITYCIQKKPMPIYGNGKNVRDWLFVDDHAEAIWKVLQFGKKGETYNIGGDEELCNLDIVHEIIKQVSSLLGEDENENRKLMTFVEDRLGHDFRYAIDYRKIKEELGWSPRHKFSEGLRDTIAWYVEIVKEEDPIGV
jgi:dTDP-glucose 4,6-dehydratase